MFLQSRRPSSVDDLHRRSAYRDDRRQRSRSPYRDHYRHSPSYRYRDDGGHYDRNDGYNRRDRRERRDRYARYDRDYRRDRSRSPARRRNPPDMGPRGSWQSGQSVTGQLRMDWDPSLQQPSHSGRRGSAHRSRSRT